MLSRYHYLLNLLAREPQPQTVLQGGKRPYHTIIPAMALRGDELFLSYGVMGGFMQVRLVVEVLPPAYKLGGFLDEC